MRPSRLRRAALLGFGGLAAVPGPGVALIAPTPAALTTSAAPAAQVGWTPVDPTSAQARAAASIAVRGLSEELARHFVVEEIRSAASRDAAGDGGGLLGSGGLFPGASGSDATDYRIALRIAQIQDDVLGTREECSVVVREPRKGSSDTDSATSSPNPAQLLTSFDCQTESTSEGAQPFGDQRR